MSLKDTNLKAKTILLRLDLNIVSGEERRLTLALPTVNYLLEQAKKVIIISHFGRPHGQVVPALSLMPFKARLPQAVELLENLRFDPREEANDETLARELALKADVFVNDAFSVCHRQHASIIGIPKFLPSFPGFLLEQEVAALSHNFPRPLVLVIGGAKLKTKLPLIKDLLPKCDQLILGGLIANAVLENAELRPISTKLHLPVDALTLSGPVGIDNVKSVFDILDIGPDTIELFKNVIALAKSIIWNGPMGKSKDEYFKNGTLAIAKIIYQKNAYKIAGGGETIGIIDSLNLASGFNHISTGGGAMLEFLAKGTLPGIIALGIKAPQKKPTKS